MRRLKELFKLNLDKIPLSITLNLVLSLFTFTPVLIFTKCQKNGEAEYI